MPGCQTGVWGRLSALVGNGRGLKCGGKKRKKEKRKDWWSFHKKGTKESLFASTLQKPLASELRPGYLIYLFAKVPLSKTFSGSQFPQLVVDGGLDGSGSPQPQGSGVHWCIERGVSVSQWLTTWTPHTPPLLALWLSASSSPLRVCVMGFNIRTFLTGLLGTKAPSSTGREPALNKPQLLLGLLFLRWSLTMVLMSLHLSSLLGAWLMGAGYPWQQLESLGRWEEELFSVDSGSICGCKLAQAAGKLWIEQAGHWEGCVILRQRW